MYIYTNMTCGWCCLLVCAGVPIYLAYVYTKEQGKNDIQMVPNHRFHRQRHRMMPNSGIDTQATMREGFTEMFPFRTEEHGSFYKNGRRR